LQQKSLKTYLFEIAFLP